MNGKIYLGLITSETEEKNIEELTSVAQDFDGLAAVYHGPDSKTLEILESRKGNGFVVKREWYGHHGRSMNEFLLHPKIRPGLDWIILRDSSERITESFAKELKTLIPTLERLSVNSVYQYSKLLLFKRFEHQIFMNTPHWVLNGVRGNSIAIENQRGFEDPKNYCYSIRNDIRPKNHKLGHFLKYYFMNDSNHLLLGRESKQEEFQQHEQKRQEFKVFCLQNDIPTNVEGFHKYLEENKNNLRPEVKKMINFEPILNCYFNHYIKGIDLDTVYANDNNGVLMEVN